MLPDEMIFYEPHRVGFARFGNRWFRVIAYYGGGDLIVDPRPVAEAAVRHERCRLGCSRKVYKSQAGALYKHSEDPPRPRLARVSWFSWSPGRTQTLALLVMGMVAGGLFTAWSHRHAPAAPAVGRALPAPGSLLFKENAWWRVQEVVDGDPRKRVPLQGQSVMRFEYDCPLEKRPKVGHLLLAASQPPGGHHGGSVAVSRQTVPSIPAPRNARSPLMVPKGQMR